mgnify:CR=1 FL=1
MSNMPNTDELKESLKVVTDDGLSTGFTPNQVDWILQGMITLSETLGRKVNELEHRIKHLENK